MRRQIRTGFYFVYVLLLASTGCSLLGQRGKVSFDSTEKLPRAIRQDLKQLTDAQDILNDQNAGDEPLRLVRQSDERNLTDYLRAMGYYDARVSGTIREHRKRTDMVYEIQPGPRYQLEHIDLHWPENYEGPRQTPAFVGQSASHQHLLAAQRGVTTNLHERGYPDARLKQKEIIIDHATRTMRASYDVWPGPRVNLGGLRANGLHKLRPSYVQKARPWKVGEPYAQSKIDELERRLASSGLFSSVEVMRGKRDGTEPVEQHDIVLTLKERAHRTIQLGTGYRSDTGAEASSQWMHRNALGGGEQFLARAKVFEEGYEGELRLTVPYFRSPRNELGLSINTHREDTDAYDSLSYEGNSWISRTPHRYVVLRGGFGLLYFDETSAGVQQSYMLGSLPFSIMWDRSNDKLDATKGYRVYGQTTPYQSLRGRDPFFWKNELTMNGFLPLRRDQSLSVALRLTAGHIDGESIDDIPAEIRFYAGGGQSVRGYAYQSLSPRRDDVIIGGKSLAESSLELRYRISPLFGLVAFVDGGTAFDDQTKFYEESYRWGAGGGVRYFSPVGPFRFDAGFPIDRRDGIDDAWQFYISIGQAF